MGQVNTVLGPIHPRQLGMTSLHEHILFSTPGWEYSPEGKATLRRAACVRENL